MGNSQLVFVLVWLHGDCVDQRELVHGGLMLAGFPPRALRARGGARTTTGAEQMVLQMEGREGAASSGGRAFIAVLPKLFSLDRRRSPPISPGSAGGG